MGTFRKLLGAGLLSGFAFVATTAMADEEHYCKVKGKKMSPEELGCKDVDSAKGEKACKKICEKEKSGKWHDPHDKDHSH